MADRPRIAVAGCGSIARLVHIPLLSRHPAVDVCALAESDAGALTKANGTVPAAQPFETLEQMLADAKPDAVVVALPTDAHAAAAAAVLNAGCDLYLEKPVAANLADGAELMAVWRDGDRIGMLGFNQRFNPLHRRLRDLVRAGRAGRPVYVRSVFATASRDMPAWKRQRATGGGVLLDLAVHHIDLMRFLFDREPVSVHATVESRRTEADTVLLEIELEDGPRVHGFFSLATVEQDQVEVYGDHARLSLSRFTSLDVDVVDNPGQGGGAAGRLMRRAAAMRHLGAAIRTRRAPLREPGYAAALDAFIQAIRTRRLTGDAADLMDGYIALAAIDAAERSALSGRVEQVDATVSPPRTAHRLMQARP